jgi:thiamine pyrophosphate-dependent acetolactate synthase large subunit-like protein
MSVPVYEHILHLLEAGGIKTLFGIPDPGFVHMAAAAIVAAKENSPTIFLAGNRARSADQHVKRGRIQYISQPKYFEAAMKYAGIIEYAGQTDDILREALRVCQSGKPGPTCVEIPARGQWPVRSAPRARHTRHNTPPGRDTRQG